MPESQFHCSLVIVLTKIVQYSVSPDESISFQTGYVQINDDGGPGFLTPDAITLLGLLTLAVLLIR